MLLKCISCECVCYVLLDEVEVTNAYYGEGKSKKDDLVLGCGVSSAVLKFMWFKNGKEIHSDDHRIIAEHKASNYSFSTVTITEIGKLLCIIVTCCSCVSVCGNIYLYIYIYLYVYILYKSGTKTHVVALCTGHVGSPLLEYSPTYGTPLSSRLAVYYNIHQKPRSRVFGKTN